MTQDYQQAWAFVAGFAGDPTTAIIDWRAIHDTDKGVPAMPFRGTVADVWQSITYYNNSGYGIFAVIAAMDGNGRKLENVDYIRAHYIDLDGMDAAQQYQRAQDSSPSPSFAVQSSPGKFHVYWPVNPYRGNDRFEALQRRLVQVYNADNIIDPTRVMRVPGTYHLKNPAAPHMVTMWALGSYGYWIPVEALETAYQHVNVISGGDHVRKALGDPDLAAPSLEWLQRGLDLLDPNTLDRAAWVGIMAAVKQAGWTLAGPETLYAMFTRWCERYEFNDPAENQKQWDSIRNTELGWKSLCFRVPSLRGLVAFGGQQKIVPGPVISQPGDPVISQPVPSNADAEPPPLDCSGEILTHIEQQEWFKGAMYVVQFGKIFTRERRFLDSSQFNAQYGGKKFIIDGVGKTTDEPYKAATRSTLWAIPKVDHVRFLPSRPFGEIIIDELGRTGVNTYKAATIRRVKGDPSPFLRHIAMLLPDPTDQKILLDYIGHNIKFPGHKIAWAPVIQSTEGAGKGVLKLLMMHAMGRPYIYFPNAQELTASGSKFNAWMRGKLFILADEIKVDDRRDLIEVLKPMISESLIEIQGKGVDQDIEDNFGNWLFFTNYKDAVPVSKNGRRYAIFYSPLQTAQDLQDRQMTEHYFNALYDWLNADGAAIVTDWFMDYPIERGQIAKRAPLTTSHHEAIKLSRSPVERAMAEALDDALPGFKGGWVSTMAVMKHLRTTGATNRVVQPQMITQLLENMGYHYCGRAERAYFAEDAERRAELYHFGHARPVSEYAAAQGYE